METRSELGTGICGKRVDSAFAKLPGTHALFPMQAIQRLRRRSALSPRHQTRPVDGNGDAPA